MENDIGKIVARYGFFASCNNRVEWEIAGNNSSQDLSASENALNRG